ncbi:hypothetical protein NPIL_605241 [Nephila pilipes]|uniref:Secreted protein n=1 Tax=Nephila pilipes TaxID=299642 RepID=A0A8X6Q9N5_NEPPI|nr:hypothetical protein NPIL_605241 [Nephila pilipes]
MPPVAFAGCLCYWLLAVWLHFLVATIACYTSLLCEKHICHCTITGSTKRMQKKRKSSSKSTPAQRLRFRLPRAYLLANATLLHLLRGVAAVHFWHKTAPLSSNGWKANLK